MFGILSVNEVARRAAVALATLAVPAVLAAQPPAPPSIAPPPEPPPAGLLGAGALKSAVDTASTGTMSSKDSGTAAKKEGKASRKRGRKADKASKTNSDDTMSSQSGTGGKLAGSPPPNTNVGSAMPGHYYYVGGSDPGAVPDPKKLERKRGNRN